MLDEFRNTDWAPRSVYRKQRQLTAAVRAVENRTGAHAAPRDIAEELGVPLEEYFQMVAATTTQRMFSLEEANPDLAGDDANHGAQPAADPCAEAESEEFYQAMSHAIRELPEREAWSCRSTTTRN